MQRVVIICSNQDYSSDVTPFPPIGTLGTIVSGLDSYNEYDVIFDGFPCYVQDISWVTHESMIAFINESKQLSKKAASCLT